MARNDFAVFILTHGRPHNMHTYGALMRAGYTGKIYFIVDDEDETLPEYKDQYGDQVIVFSKDEVGKTFDIGDNFNDKRSIIYARNFSFTAAKELGLENFIELDDDYTSFNYCLTDDFKFTHQKIKNLDIVFGAMVDFVNSTPTKSMSMAQGGDFLGGAAGAYAQNIHLLRKCMNSWVCRTDRPFEFVGLLNDDVNTVGTLGQRGNLLFTALNVRLTHLSTQQHAGGLTSVYLHYGTYVKSFYSVMYCPSFVTIRDMGETNRRIHHRVSWNNAAPKILREEHRKAEGGKTNG